MKVLGLDIGTNSIGWGIVDETEHKIIKCGVYIFPEGVKKEKGNESSKAAERTRYRSARRLKFRRKLRKYETLKVLIKNQMCPLSLEELELWRKEKIYPSSNDFVKWYRTDENTNWEPYFLRKKCVEEKAEKYEIGRALYHLAQRRGFLSNRKESTKESDGKVNESIKDLSEELGDKTLGQYFYELKNNGEKIRARYTSRKDHYEKEFNKICEIQSISDELKKELYNAIFFQRKLKSQKFLVGKCTFETNKPRCPISHFEFEEFRMLSFINSIKVAKNSTENDMQEMKFLSSSEKEIIYPLFFRKSKKTFDFKDISKKLKGKNDNWKFNYRDDTTVCGCPVSSHFIEIFGDGWKDTKINQYDIFDIWHVLFDFDDEEKLKDFAINKLQLSTVQTEKLCEIHFQQGYANLSLKAIRKILPFLRRGFLYSNAVFLANIPSMIGSDVFEKNRELIENEVLNISKTLKEKNNIITLANLCMEKIFKDENHNFHTEEWDKTILDSQIKDFYGLKKWNDFSAEKKEEIKNTVIEKIDDTLKLATTRNPNDYKYKLLRTDKLIEDFLLENGLSIKKGKKLYHPSETEYCFEKPKISEDGKKCLGSPRTPSVKNPVAMRALHQLRKLINYLIETNEIDGSTKINIELANEVNDKNWRKAIEEFQKKNEKLNDEYRKRIEDFYKEVGVIKEITESDIKKYRLYKEQEIKGISICPYTGKTINLTDLFGATPLFDFEHTIPRSISYDDSLENLTLCDSNFNRNVKKQHIPSELQNFGEINERFQKFYEDKISDCLFIIEKNKTKGGYIDPVVKDNKIVKRHIAQLELNYYIGKLKRFTADSYKVTMGFKHSQLNDTRIITKFALSYLKSVFEYVQPVNGSMTDLFKRQWGLRDRKESKDRTNYKHHIIDALTIACVNRGKYNLLCEIIKNSSDGKHIRIPKPWEDFDSDVLKAVEYVIPKHFVVDNALRQSKKLLKDRFGKPIIKNGHVVYEKGNTVRGSLHKDTFYGCIMTPPEKNIPSEKIFVQTIDCGNLDKSKAEKIIDKGIKRVFFTNLESGIQSLVEIQNNGIKLPYKLNNRDVFAKKIRIATRLSNPIIIKKHKDISEKEYKQNYYVVNDENYLIALYRAKDKNGKSISEYSVLNLYDAVSKKKNKEALYTNKMKKNNYDLSIYKVLKIGKIVILQEEENEDVFALPNEQLFSRLYRVSGIASKPDGRINFVHVIISSPFSINKEVFDNGIEKFKRISNSNLYCLVEGKDFIISPIGEIIKK